MHIISWLPHGRSWKIYNRDMFQEIALPRYFGHKNYASFVRIVNAWGFRRVTSGLDRDSYYHEVSKHVLCLLSWQILFVTDIILPVSFIGSSFFAENQSFINA